MTPLQKSKAEPVLNFTIKTHDMNAQTKPLKPAIGNVKNAISAPFPAIENNRSDRSAVMIDTPKLAL